MDLKSWVKPVLARTGLLPLVRRLAGRVASVRDHHRQIRVDPVPPMQPFPEARYIFAVGAIPRRYAGRTASVLAKTKLLGAQGVRCEILTMNYSSELDDVTEEIRARGALGRTSGSSTSMTCWPASTPIPAVSRCGTRSTSPGWNG